MKVLVAVSVCWMVLLGAASAAPSAGAFQMVPSPEGADRSSLESRLAAARLTEADVPNGFRWVGPGQVNLDPRDEHYAPDVLGYAEAFQPSNISGSPGTVLMIAANLYTSNGPSRLERMIDHPPNPVTPPAPWDPIF